jgi:hypothetical protein
MFLFTRRHISVYFSTRKLMFIHVIVHVTDTRLKRNFSNPFNLIQIKGYLIRGLESNRIFEIKWQKRCIVCSTSTEQTNNPAQFTMQLVVFHKKRVRLYRRYLVIFHTTQWNEISYLYKKEKKRNITLSFSFYFNC